jgi:hypothetical protein
VDAATAAAFGRPDGIDGGFAVPTATSNGSTHPGAGSGTATLTEAGPSDLPRNGSAVNGAASVRTGPVPHAALATAFGKPDTDVDPLQRPPGRTGPDDGGEPAFWDAKAAADPWRNPESPVGLGPPAATETPSVPAARGQGARLSFRELLFGGRVHPRALAALAVVVLLIGAVGGVVGRLTAEDASRLTSPDPTITQAIAAKERPAGSVADIAQRTVPAGPLRSRSGTRAAPDRASSSTPRATSSPTTTSSPPRPTPRAR